MLHNFVNVDMLLPRNTGSISDEFLKFMNCTRIVIQSFQILPRKGATLRGPPHLSLETVCGRASGTVEELQ